MKNGGIILSAIIGAGFFGLAYIVLSLNFLLSLIVGIAAFVAGDFVFGKSKEVDITQLSDEDVIKEMGRLNNQIYLMIPRIESADLKKDIKDIFQTTEKIIEKVSKDKERLKQIRTFIDYYLPVTLKILIKYDEIENQHLNNKDSKEFMRTVEEKIKIIANSFRNQLAALFQTDLVDVDAELGVLENMLKTEGYTDLKDFDTQERGNNNG